MTKREIYFSTRNRLAVLALFLLCFLGAKGQVSEGLYYIGSRGYNANNTTTNYYLCPTEQWAYYQSTTPYYYLYTEGCDTDQPFMTTYQCRNGEYDSKKALWVVKQSPTNSYFYVIHVMDGKYLTFNAKMASGNEGRMRVHLEALPDGEKALFQFSYVSSTSSYDFTAKSGGPNSNSRKYLNVTGASGGSNGNQPSLQATNVRADGPGNIWVGGIIGLWTDGSSGDQNSRWYLESTLLEAPTISGVSQVTGRVTLTDNNGFDEFLDNYHILYTVSTDGNAPDDPAVGDENTYTMDPEGYLVEQECIIKAVVECYGVVLTSVATSGTLVPTLPNAPTVTKNCDNTFSLVCDNMPEVDVYYTLTTNGDEPDEPTIESTRYTVPVAYESGYKIKAKAIQDGGNSSGITSYEFTSADIHTEAPVITLAATTATITAVTGATIRYTTDGTDPTSSSTIYSEPLTISETADVDIRAIAQVSGLLVSCVARADRPSEPTLTVTDGDCSPSTDVNIVTITAPNDGRTLWYTYTAGNNSAAPDPAVTSYIPYTEPVSVSDLDGTNAYYTFHAYAQSSDGFYKSDIVSVSHEMKTAGRPELTPPVGSNPVITISGGVFGDFAVCSASGVAVQNIPIASDGTAEYTIAPEATGTLTVTFKHGDWFPSCEASYVLPEAPATPTWSQECDNLLQLHCATPMADIHFTADGTEPTLASDTYVAGCLDTLSVGRRIRAKAFLGFRASGELDYTYSPLNPDEPQFVVDGTDVCITVPDGTTVYYTKSEGTEAGVVPADPDIPTSASTAYTGCITIAQDNIITVFKAIAISNSNPEHQSCVKRVVTREGYSINTANDLTKLRSNPESYFFVFNDIDASAADGEHVFTTVEEFTGVLDGNFHTISNLNKPLFDNIHGSDTHNAAVLNVMLKKVTVSTDGNAGAIANTASGYTRIYNCGILPDDPDGTTTSSISGAAYVGGLVGELDGTSRVINCFSYADINGGTHRAGIVGYNNYPSKSNDLRTMVMNCMFYGNITSGYTAMSPIYGGELIHNKRAGDNNTGLNNYCYFLYKDQDYLSAINSYAIGKGSLGAEERFLNRFEFFRLTLNSTRSLAAYYVYGNATEKEQMAKWVLDKSIAPYPILKEPGYYPSIVNFDAEHAAPIDPDNLHYNEGRKLDALTVSISGVGSGAQFSAPIDANITTSSLSLNVIDKDPNNFNFNYKKVQLPYYNQVGDGNYTKASDNTGRVVTGWKIVKINGSTTGTGTFVNTGTDAPAFNFVDRACSNKDLYSVSGRVFSQGAYWEVPDGVTSITIEPYWAKAVFLSDANYDVTYSSSTKYGVTVAGTCISEYNDQTVHNTVSAAMSALGSNADHTVYDYAVVLVGNYHQYTDNAIVNDTKPVTFMSADLDGDLEPDNTLFYYHNSRRQVSPIRFDFINIPGIGTVKRTWDSAINPQPGIFRPRGWFEITNTALIRCGQFEYASKNHKTIMAPLILQGGIYEQFVSCQAYEAANTNYILVGGNAWFRNLANGCHTEKYLKTPKVPINVAGGEYGNLYLSGIYQENGTPDPEDAECYIDGGSFTNVAGAGMQKIDGNVNWLINAADIVNFYGGGINAAQHITGNITTQISNSRVGEFYGGPKFGNMEAGKTVTTTASNCYFDLFFGAGYGGTAFKRKDCVNDSEVNDHPSWGSHVNTHYKRKYSSGDGGISTDYEYEFILHSDGNKTVARFFVNYASLSLASTRNVETDLTGCTMRKFYGGGRLGSVNGDVTSTLTDCTIEEDVFGSGYSADAPTVKVFPVENMNPDPQYNRPAGVFNDAQVKFPTGVTFTWKQVPNVSAGSEFDETNHYIYTTVDLSNLGTVQGNATLTLQGNTKVYGNVYGGGAKSNSNTNGGEAKTTVNILGGTYGTVDGGVVTGGNIYGGGMGDANNAVTEGIVELNIGSSSQSANNVVINGNVYGCNDYNGSPQGDVSVDVWVTKHNSSNTASGGTGYAIANVFGGGHLADYTPAGKTASVTIHGCENTIGRVFGGGDAAAAPGVVTVIEGGRFDWVFGGGNGEVTAANIGAGGSDLSVHGGTINHLFGGSNERGTITGAMTVNVDNTSGCGEYVDEFFGGCNLVELGTPEVPVSLSTAIGCGTKFGSVYGGSNKANIYGNVTLTIEGGEMDYVYGGSKGVAVGDTEYPDGLSANISGNVMLTLKGGTIANAFGGSNILGSIGGEITVFVEDAEDPDCPLVLTDVFGGGNLAVYGGRPTVKVKHGTVLGNVYGGGNGDPADNTQTKGSTGAPIVIIGDNNADHQAIVVGDVYGGGNAAKVSGSTATEVQVVNKCNTEVRGAVYGGGNMALVPATSVIIDGGTIGDVFGGGHGDNNPGHLVAANVTGNTSVSVTGAKINRVFAGTNLNGTIGGDMSLSINKSATANCDMIIREVYGGGNFAAGKAAPITIGNTGDIVAGSSGHLALPENIGTTLEGIGTLYGGANQAAISTDVTLDINTGIINKVFGGNNTSGEIDGDIIVNIEQNNTTNGWYVGEVYGGGNLAAYSGSPQVNITNGLVSNNVYGGGKGNTAIVTGNPVVTIGDNDVDHVAVVSGDVYGGGDAAAVTGTTTVAYNDNNASSSVGNLFGGGNEAGVSSTATVTLTSGKVVSGIYGGCNSSGDIGGMITVNVNGGTVGALTNVGTLANVFGGGFGASTTTDDNVEVNITGGNINGDVYGGSALGEVNGGSSNTTIVNVTGGTLNTIVTTTPGGFSIYNGGNVYGGGLGRKDDPSTTDDEAVEAKVYGTVTVNIGSCTPNGADPGEGDHTGNAYSGNATIQGNVYGCNNTNGSPQQNVTVNIYQTAHTQGVDEVGDAGYAIHNVFGGGNEADFRVDEKTTTVNVFGCDNTIERTFGGGNAAATNSVITDIKGGRIHDVFGGGNGEVSAADIYGNITLGIHGGTIGQSYSISNQNGVVTGYSSVVIDNNGCGGVQVEDHFMGGNFATVYGELNSEITCEGGMVVKNLYGGCKQADVLKYPSVEEVEAHHYDGTYPDYVIELYDANPTTYASTYAEKFGNVHLTVNGGTYENVYGGSQGTPERGANIEGDVQLDIYGGTITKAIFGGSHIKGSIGGKIVVTVDYDPTNQCALDVSKADVYGGGNQADYTAPYVSGSSGPRQDYPVVNIKRATVNNVFGGGLEADVTGNPRVAIWKYAKVLGNVYGGGNQGEVTGNPKVIVNGEKAGKLE